MAIQLLPTETSIWRIVQSIIQLVQGRHNAGGTVTLSTTTATVVSQPNCSQSSWPVLTPINAAAAAEIGAGTLFISDISNGSFTITHSASGSARMFVYQCGGG